MRRSLYSYRIVNVFAESPFTGKAVAVFPDASGLDTASMAAVARELHFPQTVFVLPPRDGSGPPKVRVFTPQVELPRGGLPMIATVFALQLDKQPGAAFTRPDRFVLEEEEEPVSVAFSAPVFTVRHEVPTFGPVYPERETAAAMLSLRPDQLAAAPVEVASSGVPYLMIPLKSAQVLAAAQLRGSIWERTLRSSSAPNVLAFTLKDVARAVLANLRVFTPEYGVFEESASESAVGPLLGYILRHNLAELPSAHSVVFQQGTEVGRPSYLHGAYERSGTELRLLRVGGQCIAMGEGNIYV
jgi:trans-2,3-dihydro-3-hydroxyanthranilate isomerase